MKNIKILLIAIILIFTILAEAKDLQILQKPAPVGIEQADVTVIATTNEKYRLNGETLSKRKLKKALKKIDNLKYLNISGDEITISHIIEAAKIGDKLGFQILYDNDGKLKTLELLD